MANTRLTDSDAGLPPAVIVLALTQHRGEFVDLIAYLSTLK